MSPLAHIASLVPSVVVDGKHDLHIWPGIPESRRVRQFAGRKEGRKSNDKSSNRVQEKDQLIYYDPVSEKDVTPVIILADVDCYQEPAVLQSAVFSCSCFSQLIIIRAPGFL